MHFFMGAIVATISISLSCNAVAANCDLVEQFSHRNKIGVDRNKKPVFRQVPIYGNNSELFFTGDMAINTDGAPNSYHPDDPWGDRGNAINTICNGANAIMPDGSKVDYSDCRALITAFNDAKASGWENKRRARMDFFAIAHHGYTPCLIQSGEYKGNFVSMTKLPADSSKDDCDQTKWLDALSIPFIIVPKKSGFIEAGVRQGDLAVLYNPRNKALSYAIVGDEGPQWGLAEGSVALGKTLNERSDNPRSRRETYSFVANNIKVMIFPKSKMSEPFTKATIDSAGKAVFEKWGGKDRFDKCVLDLH